MKVEISMKLEIQNILQRITNAGLGGYELSDTVQEAVITGLEQWAQNPLYSHVFNAWRKDRISEL